MSSRYTVAIVVRPVEKTARQRAGKLDALKQDGWALWHNATVEDADDLDDAAVRVMVRDFDWQNEQEPT